MAAVIWSPFADEVSAAGVGRQMVEEKLVACANVVGPMRSIFAWNGEVSEAQECGVLFKTTAAMLDRAIARLEQLHPYDTPAIMGWQCDAVPDATRKWLSALDAGSP